jgi:Domain of unknown function (DUF6436)
MSIDSLNLPASTMPPRSALTMLSWALLIVWLISSVASFWLFELRDWRAFEPAGAAFADLDTAQVESWYRSTTDSMQAPGAPARFTLVHLYNPECRCNRFAEPHLKRLADHFQSLGVKFIAVPDRTVDVSMPAPAGLPVVVATHSALVAAGVKSSPAALIFDANGRLVYYGPYSDSAWCGSTGNLVEPVLDRALSGLATVRRPRASRGCFCGW